MTDQSFETMRRAMVASQLRTTAVNDARVVAAMGAVPRERFVPADRASLAYIDGVIPLGSGRALNMPMVTGRLLTEARTEPGDRALLIGCATGYAAALLALLVAGVVAVDEDKALLDAARGAVDAANVSFVDAPLTAGCPQHAPFNLIVIDGAVEAVPAALIGQLAEGGRLVTGLVERGVTRLAAGRKTGSGFGLLAFADAEAVILPGFAAPSGFKF
jgi:protein-L-isoaspartate(D-aspartate) O-methyltransferase